MANVFEPDFDAEQDKPPFTWRRARLGRQAGAEALGASLFELPPGASSFPLHVHHANEEMLVVLAGRPTLRSIDGERELGPGSSWPARPAARRPQARQPHRRAGPLPRDQHHERPRGERVPRQRQDLGARLRPRPPAARPSELDTVVPDQPEVDYLDGER